jgi:hypothetical protein
MKDLKQFNLTELKTIEKFTAFLADSTGEFGNADFSDKDLIAAEESAKEFARARNGNKTYHSDFGATEDDKELRAGVRNWIERNYKRGHGKRK